MASLLWAQPNPTTPIDAFNESKNNVLLGRAISATPDERGGLLSQVAMTDPRQALAFQGEINQQQDTDEDRRNKQLVNMSRMLVNAPEQYRDQLYQQIKPSLAKFGLSQVPDVYTPEVGQVAKSIVDAWTPPKDPKVLSPGSVLTDNMGNVLHKNPFGQQYQNVPMGTGKVAGSFDKNTGNLRPAVSLGSSGTSEQDDPMKGYIDAANQAVKLGADPDKVEAWLQDQAGKANLQPNASGAPASDQPGPQFGVGTRPNTHPTFSTLTADEVKANGLPPGTVAQKDSNGRITVVSKGGDANGAVDSGLSTDAVENAAWDKILMGKTIPGFSKNAIDQRTAVANKVAEIAKQSGVSPQELSTTQGRVKALQSSMTNLQKQVDVQAKNEETFLNNADIMLKLSDKVGRSGVPAFNGLILKAKTNFSGDPDAAAFAAARNIVANEYSKIASGATGAAGATQGSQEHALSLINNAQTPEQLQSVIATLHEDIEGQKRASLDQLDLIHQRMQQFGSSGPKASSTQHPSPTTQAEYDALPSGSTYVDPDDGRTYRKP